jgi:HAD superfamily hydrolase (TIGR01484 family)
MPNTQKKMIIFDLDGTLAVSKQPLDEEMAGLLRQLLHLYMVGVISGGFFEQYEKQFLSNLHASKEELHNLVLLPTSGSVMYRHDGNRWQETYCKEIRKNEREKIISYFNEAIENFSLRPETSYGDLVEDRRTQITYSGLGQSAPPDVKASWDPDRKKRTLLATFMKAKLPQYSVGIGGMTSVDVTLPGIDKAYGIRKIEETLYIPISQMVFVGDALEEGGNDYPAKTTGVDCVAVKGPEETKEYIRNIL